MTDTEIKEVYIKCYGNNGELEFEKAQEPKLICSKKAIEIIKNTKGNLVTLVKRNIINVYNTNLP